MVRRTCQIILPRHGDTLAGTIPFMLIYRHYGALEFRRRTAGQATR